MLPPEDERMARFRANPKLPEKLCSACGAEFRGLYASVVTRLRTHPVPPDVQAEAKARGEVVTITEGPQVCSLRCLREVQASWPRHPDAAGMLDRRPKYEAHGQVDPFGAEIDGDLVMFGTWKAVLPEEPPR